MLSPIETYLQQIEAALKQGDSTEHTHRPFLKSLIESLGEKIIATNEPKRKHGNAPDFVVLQDRVPIGHVEAKDIGVSLAAVEKTEQLKRYRKSLNNLILTNYLDFVWYENGELRNSISLAKAMPDGSVIRCFDGDALLASIIRQFFETEVPIVTSAEDLAVRMANRARELEASVESVLRNDASPSLRGLMEEFKKELITDLDDIKFADNYTQTLAYGLFTACYFMRASTHNPSQIFNREAAFVSLPRSNPFLKRMFQQIAGFDLDEEPFVWAVDNLAALLNRVDMSEVMKDFGKGKDDPVIHFYETFLNAYNPKLRELRGVYYTPTPVVGYIVRSVDQILKRDFGIADGLASNNKLEDGNSHKVLILDPATGTGTFLSKVIDLIYEKKKREPAIWKGYVEKDLLPRLFGFEFLVAPYSIAHLKLGLQLAETGYEFHENERLNIFLTNTLEEAHALGTSETGGMGYWIHEEATKAQAVKKDAPVMVILGNPPYSGHSANEGEWMRNLLRGIETTADGTRRTENYFEVDGKPLGEKNPKWLNNDYVKFIRFSQWRIEQTGYGILAFITSNSYLDSPTFRGMRESLMNTFDDIYILDLHGNSKKKEKNPIDGSADQNVFDITEGVSIGIFVKKPVSADQPSHRAVPADVRKSSAFPAGETNDSAAAPPFDDARRQSRENEVGRDGKAQLFRTSNGEAVRPYASVFHHDIFGVREVFDRTEKEKQVIGGKYKYLRENDITQTDWNELEPQSPSYFFVQKSFERLAEYERASKMEDIFLLRNMGVTTGADSTLVQFDRGDHAYVSPHQIIDYSYRPFDHRLVRYDPNLLARARVDIMRHLAISENVSLAILRSPRNDIVANFFVSRGIVDKSIISSLDNAYILPLYIYTPKLLVDDGNLARHTNIVPRFKEDISRKLDLEFIESFEPGAHPESFPSGLTPEDIFGYAYAIFHSPEYRSRYAEFLKIDFPRLPLTSDVELFRKLVALGVELVKTHLLERDLPEICTYPADGDSVVEAIRFDETLRDKGRVWINSKQYFDHIPTEVWNFYIGGYQVCHKWLKDRKGRTLNFDDLIHYKKIVSALSETIRLMSEIDDVIAEHGGFPLK